MHSISDLQPYKTEILSITRRHGASNIRVFGSVARGEAQKGSDVDFLVDLEPERSLMDLAGLLIDLEDLLDCKVQVLTEKGIHWYIKDKILNQAVNI
ncbi:MAG: nucleotidyltransferase family protein [Candidatus Eremiobacteraeota bacterium]|nr:nucleotidyltransferase family protein [Candidatus Eremiobacteraeota bacterium]